MVLKEYKKKFNIYKKFKNARLAAHRRGETNPNPHNYHYNYYY